MATKCKLFYMNDLPLDPNYPLRAVTKAATGQKSEIIEQVEDYGQVTYHSDSEFPNIKNLKGRTLKGNLLPAPIPKGWEIHMPDTLGFHMHEHLELTLVTEGRILYIVDGQFLEVSAGDAVFFGSYIPHSWIVDASAPVQITELSFKADFVERFKIPNSPVAPRLSAGNLKYQRIPAENGETAQRILTVASELDSHSFGNRFSAALELNLILLTLLRRIGTLPEKSQPGMSAVISAAREYIAAHLSENPGLSEIAGAVYVTPQHLSYLFKKQVGIGIADYMNQQKILRSAELLSDSDLSMQDIALQSGFTSRSNFYRIFKEYYGIPPKQMRDALINEKLSKH